MTLHSKKATRKAKRQRKASRKARKQRQRQKARYKVKAKAHVSFEEKMNPQKGGTYLINWVYIIE